MYGNIYSINYGYVGNDFLYKEIYIIPFEEKQPEVINTNTNIASVFSFGYFPLILLFIIFFILYKVLK